MTDNRRQTATGIAGLDHLLRGGLPRGHLYLIIGPSGAGKTTLGLQFLMEGARSGETCLYVSTAEGPGEIQEVAVSHGWDLTGVQIRYITSPARMGPRQTMLHPVEVELPQVMSEITSAIDEVAPVRLVIDSLNEIRLLSREAGWFRDQIMALKQHLAGRDCTTLLTDLRHDEPPVLRSAVHGVIELDQYSPVYGPDRRRLRVAKIRGLNFRTGYHDMSFQTGGIKVYPRLVAAEHRDGRTGETISSGVPEFDQLLMGGLDRGTSTLFMGPTGTGKSTLVTHCVVAAARRGEKAAMFVFDERIQTLFQRSRNLGLELEEHVAAGRVTVRQVDPAELTPGQFGQAVLDEVSNGASMIAIDSLNGYAYAMPDERLLTVHLHELLSILAQNDVTSLHVLTQHGLFAQVVQPFDVSYIADTIILLRPYEFRGEVRKALSVHKRRSGNHERTIREFDLSQGRLIVGKPLTDFTGVISGHPEYISGMLDRPKDDE